MTSDLKSNSYEVFVRKKKIKKDAIEYLMSTYLLGYQYGELIKMIYEITVSRSMSIDELAQFIDDKIIYFMGLIIRDEKRVTDSDIELYKSLL